MGLHERMSEENAWGKGPGIREGVDAEAAIFGHVQMPVGQKIEHMPFENALLFAKQNQPSQLSRHKIVSTLRNMVAERAGNTDKPIKFYTAVGSSLDIYHGIDGFFEQDGVTITCDISLREKESFKADVLIVATMSADGVVNVSEAELTNAANSIAAQFDRSAKKRAA